MSAERVHASNIRSFKKATGTLKRKLSSSVDVVRSPRGGMKRRQSARELPLVNNITAFRAYSEGEMLTETRENTVGFMSMFNDSAKYTLECKIEERRKERDQPAQTPELVSEVQALCKAFPDFPRKLIPWLLLRYDGNAVDLFDFLVARDWDVSPPFVKKTLRNEKDAHYTTQYFFGPAPSASELKSLFEGQKTGSFITFYRYSSTNTFKYFLCYQLPNGDTLEKPMKVPEVPGFIKAMLGLTQGLKASKERQSSSNFVPCLEKILSSC